MNLNLSVYLVTDADLAASKGRDVARTVKEAVAGGVTAVQVREKNKPAADFLVTVMNVAAILPTSVSLFVNDRVDVFLAARASGARVTGVHVGQSDLPVPLVRDLVGEDAMIGLSAATPDELADVSLAQVDYVGIGALRSTATKPDAPRPLGIDGFERLAAGTGIPAVAIGGIAVADMGRLRRAGAAGAAVVSGICAADDPEVAARAFAAAWDRA